MNKTYSLLIVYAFRLNKFLKERQLIICHNEKKNFIKQSNGLYRKNKHIHSIVIILKYDSYLTFLYNYKKIRNYI